MTAGSPKVTWPPLHRKYGIFQLLVNQHMGGPVVPQGLAVVAQRGAGTGVNPACIFQEHRIVGCALNDNDLLRAGQHIAELQVQGIGCRVCTEVQLRDQSTQVQAQRQRAEVKAHVGHQHLRAVGGGFALRPGPDLREDLVLTPKTLPEKFRGLMLAEAAPV